MLYFKRKVALLLFLLQTKNSLSQSDFDLLPDHDNKILILQNCISCHSIKLITQNKMSKNLWLKTIRWMQEEHNLKIFNKDEEEKIIDYLDTFFSSDNSQAYWEKRHVNPLP